MVPDLCVSTVFSVVFTVILYEPLKPGIIKTEDTQEGFEVTVKSRAYLVSISEPFIILVLKE